MLTAFCYGCNLGPTQTARHMHYIISPRMFSYINYQYVNAEKLDYSVADIINFYHRFEMTHFWGSGKAAGACRLSPYRRTVW